MLESQQSAYVLLLLHAGMTAHASVSFFISTAPLLFTSRGTKHSVRGAVRTELAAHRFRLYFTRVESRDVFLSTQRLCRTTGRPGVGTATETSHSNASSGRTGAAAGGSGSQTFWSLLCRLTSPRHIFPATLC